ncbi:MAG: sulfatase-like hydrolase/transferase [Chloroflexi bacterium]|nr:sulfatase-like hydrolase/transferase [Chloroflexota bacterium]
MPADQQRPNIVFLFPDQFRADFAGCNGADWLQTPNIDSIAENGVRYTNSFSASPICVPARTALLTRMNAMRNGVTGNLHNLRADWRDAGLPHGPRFLARTATTPPESAKCTSIRGTNVEVFSTESSVKTNGGWKFVTITFTT